MKKVIAIAALCLGVIVVRSQNPPSPPGPGVFFAEWHLESGAILQIRLSTNVTATMVKVKATGKDPRNMLLYETNRVVEVMKTLVGLPIEVQGINVEPLGTAMVEAPAESKQKTVAIPMRMQRIAPAP